MTPRPLRKCRLTLPTEAVQPITRWLEHFDCPAHEGDPSHGIITDLVGAVFTEIIAELHKQVI